LDQVDKFNLMIKISGIPVRDLIKFSLYNPPGPSPSI
jgi:hypothetical protein